MKTLKTIVLGMAMVACFGMASAKNHDNDKLTKNYAINTYIDAMTRGRLSGLNDVIDNSAAFSTVRGNKLVTADKKQVLDYFKSIKNTEQICTTTTSVVENNAWVAIVKVDMKYEGFTRSNYVTIANTGSGWKITNVYTTFS